jgi:hypothetical protein
VLSTQIGVVLTPIPGQQEAPVPYTVSQMPLQGHVVQLAAVL